MLYFPQLSSGAISQLPLRRRTGYRTLLNQPLGGSEIRVEDADLFERSWELPLDELSDGEWQAIQNLFFATEGRLKSFLFLEPGENLLAWSQNFTAAAWTATGVSVTGGIGDPFGGTAASSLSGAGSITQSLNIPAWLQYAASIWARTSGPGAGLQLSDGGSQQQTAGFISDGQWRRYSLHTAWTTTSETVQFRVAAPGAVDIYGAQLEAQPAASAYKKTLAVGGVHPGARFDSDTLGDRATGPGRHSSIVRIAWTPSQT
ncbi:MAG: hypothetical protein HY236_13680 [Acidobacteria bacterium]|nr:hypothetical protein [Acidobacteriota bacterium]